MILATEEEWGQQIVELMLYLQQMILEGHLQGIKLARKNLKC